MHSSDQKARAVRAFYLAHQFLDEFGIRWLPVCPEDILCQRENWKLKYVSQLAMETGHTEEHILNHVMRSQDGLTIYDRKYDSYAILINAADYLPPGRVLWTKMHEIGHIYLGHLKQYKASELRESELGGELYQQLEFEADLFAGEVLASKWLLRQMDIVDEEDIAEICGLSDTAALNRYHRATEDYDYVPANVTFTIQRFSEYLKEIAVCMDAGEIELGRLGKRNPPQPVFQKPMAPFLRKAGVCPYCGRAISHDASFCAYCGTPQKKQNKAKEYCGAKQKPETVFCERCGQPMLRIRQGFCFEECEI